MMSDDLIDDFITLFRGRADCYGAWEGGCIREPLTQDTFRNHLTGDTFIGVYPAFNHKNETLCIWGCTDIDYDNPDEAWLLHDAFEAAGVKSWVEKTRRGYHIWVFATDLVFARNMRRMFLAAHQVADLPAKEVNPKQEKLHGTQIGNYVRLPYPNHGKPERVFVNRDSTIIPIDVLLQQAIRGRTTPDVIERLAGFYKPPTITYTAGTPSHDMTEAARMLTPLGRAIFRDGPIEGRDRSTTLTHLAHECRKASLHPKDAMSLLEDADIRWGKYLARGEAGRLELEKLLVRAYGHIPSS